MKQSALISASALCSIFMMGCQSNIQTRELLGDLDYYVNTIYEAHSDPFRRISREEFEKKVETLKRYVLANKDQEISTIEWFYHLQELAASMQDGHTNIWFPGGSWSSLEPIFPFRLKVIDSDVYVIEKWGKDMLTELDPPYESKEELKIGGLLDQYGIPFFYRQATIIYDQGQNEIRKPSFTLYPYGGLVIDYVPGSGEEQKDELLRREQVYQYNQVPAVLVGPEDLMEPNWEEILYGRVEQAYQQEFDPMRYTPATVEK